MSSSLLGDDALRVKLWFDVDDDTEDIWSIGSLTVLWLVVGEVAQDYGISKVVEVPRVDVASTNEIWRA